MAEDLIPFTERVGAELARTREINRGSLRARSVLFLRNARARAPHRSGELRRALAVRSSDKGIGLSMPAKYAPQEFGATIKPRGRFLAVPVSAAARSLAGPRSDGALFVLVARDGRRFLARRGSAGLDLRWRLVRRVRIRGRRFVGRAMDTERKELPDRLLSDLTKAVLGG